MWMAWWISRRMRALDSAGIAFSALSSRDDLLDMDFGDANTH